MISGSQYRVTNAPHCLCLPRALRGVKPGICDSLASPNLQTTKCAIRPYSGLVLFVTDFLHPVNRFAVELFLNRDVRHGRGRGSAMPMLFTGREPDHVTRPNFLDGASPALCQAAASRHNKGLTRMAVR